MKARLIDKSIYNITRAEIVNGCLELDLKENTAEELQRVFSNPANLTAIDLLTDEEDVFSRMEGWTKYGGITLSGEKKTVILTQAARSGGKPWDSTSGYLRDFSYQLISPTEWNSASYHVSYYARGTWK